MFTIK